MHEPFLVFHCFQVAKNYCIRGIGHDFFVETFCLAVPKKIVEELFSV